VSAYQLQSRSLEGHEACGVVRAEEKTDDPESKSVCIGLLVIAGTVQAATFINACPFVITSSTK
jgi:hypothetical protein